MADLIGESLDVDGLDQMADEALGQEAFVVLLHGERGQRDHRKVAGGGVVAQRLEGGHAVHARQLDVHQDQVRAVLAGQLDAVFGGSRFRRAKAAVLEEVARKLQVLLVILDDQDQLVGHAVLPSGWE